MRGQEASASAPLLRTPLLYLRLSALLAVGYRVLYQYNVAGMFERDVPLAVLIVWLLVEHTCWTSGVWTLTRGRVSRGWIAGNISGPALARFLAALGLLCALIFVAAQMEIISSVLVDAAALACVATRAVAVWLVGQEFLALAVDRPNMRLVGSVRLVQRLLTLALALWFLGWGVAAIDRWALLGLLRDPHVFAFVHVVCSLAEWLIISSSLGAILVLGRFLPTAR